jgi:hypothetical protein
MVHPQPPGCGYILLCGGLLARRVSAYLGVVPRRSALLVFLLCITSFRVPAQQPLSEEEKKRLFLKAREEMTTIPYIPPAPTATPKPKPRTTIVETPAKPPPPVPVKPVPKPPVPPVQPVQPAPSPRANIVVRDSGVSKADDDEEPPQKEESVWSRIFSGGGGNYTYLTPAIRRAIDRAPVTKGRWRNIVVHNSGTRQGNAAAFEHYHRYVRRMPNGLAYHFVIGNGTSSKDGAIEIGNRWHHQIQGGHVHSDYLNNISIGICLVGDFNNDNPTAKQKEALVELIKYLRRRVGRVGGQQAVVWAHKNINPPRWPTDCPGRKFPVNWLERMF